MIYLLYEKEDEFMKFLDYDEKMGEVSYPDGFFELIKDLPISEQMKFFRTTTSIRRSHENWNERNTEYTHTLDEDENVKAIILKDGYIAGVIIYAYFLGSEKAVMPERCVCTYYASENNGSGYKEREEYTYLICINANELC